MTDPCPVNLCPGTRYIMGTTRDAGAPPGPKWRLAQGTYEGNDLSITFSVALCSLSLPPCHCKAFGQCPKGINKLWWPRDWYHTVCCQVFFPLPNESRLNWQQSLARTFACTLFWNCHLTSSWFNLPPTPLHSSVLPGHHQKWQWALCKQWHCHPCSHILQDVLCLSSGTTRMLMLFQTMLRPFRGHPGTCGVVTFQWRWLMPGTTSLSREAEELQLSANTRDGYLLTAGLCYSFLCYPCKYLFQVFHEWKISALGFFALDIEKRKPKHRGKWERKRRNEGNTDKTREKC